MKKSIFMYTQPAQKMGRKKKEFAEPRPKKTIVIQKELGPSNLNESAFP
jgi:hypothetical protein